MAKPTSEVETQVRAAAKFTDRLDPQKAFWNNYDYILQHPDEFKVLYYYGFGGIGKTALCKELGKQLNEKTVIKDAKPTQSKYIYFSFDNCQDYYDVLKVLAIDLKTKYSFEFPLFYYAQYIYSLKIGGDAQKPEIKSLLNSCSYIENVMDFAQNIPVFGSIGVSILKLADKVQTHIREGIEKNKNDILYMESLEIEELKEKLPIYFIKDLNDNLTNEKVPFIIFLDTYEKLTNAIRKAESVAVNEEWLWHGSNGILRRVSNVLWVVAGQNQLKSRWVSFDKFWDDETALEEHRIERLGEEDTSDFLKSVNIMDNDMIAIISEKAKGVPITLDLCVDTYFQQLQMGKQPTEEDFEGDNAKLAKRFVGNLKDTDKDMIGLLSCFESWREDELSSPLLNVVEDAYKRVKSLAFIIEENKTYYMHGSVREVLYEDCGQLIKNRYYSFIKERLQSLDCTPDRKRHYFLHKLQFDLDKLAEMEPDQRNTSISIYYEELSDVLNDYLDAMEYVAFEETYSTISKTIQRYRIPLEYSYGFELINMIYLVKLGKTAEAMAATKKLEKILDSRSPDKYYPNYLKCLGELYKEIGDYEAAVISSRKYYHACEAIPEGGMDTIIALGQLADNYLSVRNHMRAEESYHQIIRIVNEKYASNNRMQIELVRAYRGLGKVYYSMNKDEEAIKITEKAMELIYLLQKDHPRDDLQWLLAGCYNKLGDIYLNFGQTELALKYYLMMDKITDEILEHQNSDTRRRDKVIGYARIGDFYQTIRQYDQAKDYYGKALQVSTELYNKNHSEKNAEFYIWSNMKIAKLNSTQYKYRDALQMYNKCLEECEKVYVNRTEERILSKYSELYGKIAKVYMELGDLDKALENYTKELDYELRICGDKKDAAHLRSLSVSYNHLGKCYQKRKQYKEAIKYFRKDWSISKDLLERTESVSNLKEFMTSCSGVGSLYFEMGDYQYAEIYSKMEYDTCEKLYQLMQTETMISYLRSSSSTLGDLYIHTKKYDKAISYVERELEMAKKNIELHADAQNYKCLFYAYEHMITVYIETGAFDHARQTFEEAITILHKVEGNEKNVLQNSTKAICGFLLSYGAYLVQHRMNLEVAEKYLLVAYQYGYYRQQLDFYYYKALAYQNYHKVYDGEVIPSGDSEAETEIRVKYNK